MADLHTDKNLHLSKFVASTKLKTISFAFVAIGVIGVIIGLLKNQERLWTSYLVAFFFVSCLALGGLFWVAIQNLSKAGWSTSIRRISEGMASFLPVMVVASLILIVGIKKLYPWADADYLATHDVVNLKTGYLNAGFLVARLLVFGLGMIFFARKIIGQLDQTRYQW